MFVNSRSLYTLQTIFQNMKNPSLTSDSQSKLLEYTKKEDFQLALNSFLSRTTNQDHILLSLILLQKQKRKITNLQLIWTLKDIYYRSMGKVAQLVYSIISTDENIYYFQEFLKVDLYDMDLGQVNNFINLLRKVMKKQKFVMNIELIQRFMEYFLALFQLIDIHQDLYLKALVCLLLFYIRIFNICLKDSDQNANEKANLKNQLFENWKRIESLIKNQQGHTNHCYHHDCPNLLETQLIHSIINSLFTQKPLSYSPNQLKCLILNLLKFISLSNHENSYYLQDIFMILHKYKLIIWTSSTFLELIQIVHFSSKERWEDMRIQQKYDYYYEYTYTYNYDHDDHDEYKESQEQEELEWDQQDQGEQCQERRYRRVWKILGEYLFTMLKDQQSWFYQEYLGELNHLEQINQVVNILIFYRPPKVQSSTNTYHPNSNPDRNSNDQISSLSTECSTKSLTTLTSPTIQKLIKTTLEKIYIELQKSIPNIIIHIQSCLNYLIFIQKYLKKLDQPQKLMQTFSLLARLASREPKLTQKCYQVMQSPWRQLTFAPINSIVSFLVENLQLLNENVWGACLKNYTCGLRLIIYLQEEFNYLTKSSVTDPFFVTILNTYKTILDWIKQTKERQQEKGQQLEVIKLTLKVLVFILKKIRVQKMGEIMQTGQNQKKGKFYEEYELDYVGQIIQRYSLLSMDSGYLLALRDLNNIQTFERLLTEIDQMVLDHHDFQHTLNRSLSLLDLLKQQPKSCTLASSLNKLSEKQNIEVQAHHCLVKILQKVKNLQFIDSIQINIQLDKGQIAKSKIWEVLYFRCVDCKYEIYQEYFNMIQRIRLGN